MSKQEYIRILILLSQMEGFMLGKQILPEYIHLELDKVVDLLAQYIRGEDNE